MERYPLKDLRVINFGWVWAAPALGQVLGDMGAEVVKIESRKRPDMVRVIPPLGNDEPLESYYGHCILRDHLGITLDLATPRGHELACDLVRSADVVIENFSPRVMRGYGLDYQGVRALRPDVVMISMSAAGQNGPHSQITTYGSIIACLAGIDTAQGYLDDGKPVAFGTAISDPLVGVLGAFCVLAALKHRGRTGRGQYIDLSQWEAITSMLAGPMLDCALNGRIETPIGNRDETMAPHGVFPSKGNDRWVTIAVRTDREWRTLSRAMGCPALADDPRFADGFRRQRHQDELERLIGAWTRGKDHWEVAKALQAGGIAAFPAFSSQEVFEDPHYAERQTYIEVEQRTGRQTIYGVPWKLSKTPGGVRRAAPSVGQDNQQVYSEMLGLSLDEIAALERDKVLY